MCWKLDVEIFERRFGTIFMIVPSLRKDLKVAPMEAGHCKVSKVCIAQETEELPTIHSGRNWNFEFFFRMLLGFSCFWWGLQRFEWVWFGCGLVSVCRLDWRFVDLRWSKANVPRAFAAWSLCEILSFVSFRHHQNLAGRWRWAQDHAVHPFAACATRLWSKHKAPRETDATMEKEELNLKASVRIKDSTRHLLWVRCFFKALPLWSRCRSNHVGLGDTWGADFLCYADKCPTVANTVNLFDSKCSRHISPSFGKWSFPNQRRSAHFVEAWQWHLEG